MRMRFLRIACGLVLAGGCVDGANGNAGQPPDPEDPPLTTTRNGGEIRLEWISKDGMTTARMGAFFNKTAPQSLLPSFPGCVDLREPHELPFAGPTTPLDVGGVTIVPKTGVPFEMVREMNTTDPSGRLHELWWSKPATFGVPGDADTYLPPNESYDVILTGSTEWPHQVHAEAAFMPERWTPDKLETVLTRDQDYTDTYAPVTSSNLPIGLRVNNYVTFDHPTLGPIVACQEEGTDGALKVPAALVNVIIDNAGPVVNGHATPLPPKMTARMVRRQDVHRVLEINDGTETKTVDVLAIYSYDSAWTHEP
jgi:hypothetical protein